MEELTDFLSNDLIASSIHMATIVVDEPLSLIFNFTCEARA